MLREITEKDKCAVRQRDMSRAEVGQGGILSNFSFLFFLNKTIKIKAGFEKLRIG